MSGPTRRIGDATLPKAPDNLPLGPGDRAGRFSIVRVIAAGGFGTVVQAHDPAHDCDVAVKILHGELAATDDAVRRFEREIEVLAHIEHPGIVRVLDRGRVADGRPYFAMELLDGADLEAHLAPGPMSVRAAATILTRVAAALAAAHDRGIIHRDVKASNVFLCADGRVCLLDFGIAKLAGQGASLTRSRQAVGTPTSMAPEQLAGEPVDPRTDVYALGALAYHMITGQPPFAGEPSTIVSHLHRYAARPRPSAHVAVPAAVDTVIARAMSVRPADRYPTAEAMAAAFAQAGSPDESSETVTAVAVRVTSIPPEGPAARALAAAETAFDLVAGPLADAGFAATLETSFDAFYARPVPEPDRLDQLIAGLRRRAGAAGLDLAITVARGEAEARAGVVIGGPVIEQLWRSAPPRG